MQPKPHPRSTEQALRQQRVDAERDRLAAARKAAQQKLDEIDRLTAKSNGQPRQEIVPAPKQAVAIPDTRTEHQKYLDEVAPSTIAGRPIKFDGKIGKFLYGDTGEEISPEIDFIVLCDETQIGWIKFYHDDETPPDRIMGLLYDGFVLPPRDSLGDRDQSRWELYDGKPSDPWLHQMNLVLQTPGTLELATFRTTNKTGRRAVGNLLKHYDRMRRKDDDHYPVVRLKPGGYTDKDPRVGYVYTPTFTVVGKAPKASASIPDTSLASDLNDEIPE
jgi:hypothetical protein